MSERAETSAADMPLAVAGDTVFLLARLDALAAEAADVARENEALIEEVRASGEQIAALAAERDTWKALAKDLDEQLGQAVRNTTTMTKAAHDRKKERDAAVARAERAETALPDPGKLWSLATWLDGIYPNDAKPEVQDDLRAWARRIHALGLHPDSWVVKVEEGAPPASEGE